MKKNFFILDKINRTYYYKTTLNSNFQKGDKRMKNDTTKTFCQLFAKCRNAALILLMALIVLPFAGTKAASAASPAMSVVIPKGSSISLAIAVNPSSVQSATWKSSNTSVASVDSYGTVTAKKNGSATISAVSGGKTYKMQVMVAPALKSISLNKTSIQLYVGETYTLKGTLNPSTASAAKTWKSSSTSVASVSSSGKVTAKKAGTATITVTANGKKATCTVTVMDKKYKVEGKITNAANGKALSGASLKFRKGSNNKTGSIYASTTTNSSGKYSVSLPVGTYTMAVSKTGYTTSYTNIQCKKTTSSTKNYIEASITTTLSSSQYRIVLSWGYSPFDLDSHLSGPSSSTSSSRFHVYWSNKNGYKNGSRIANLDVDDRSSYGPETITLDLRSGTSGTYRYFVYDYSNRTSSTSKALANSGARVAVYKGNTQIASYYVPNKVGNKWHVFNIVNGKIQAVNSVSYHYNNSSTIG